MRFPEMLKELIKLSGRTQKTLSAALMYSPGEVSKILSGQRVPTPEGARQLVDRGAAFFGAALWTMGNQARIDSLFPLHPVMHSQQDLCQFIARALWASYEQQTQASVGDGAGTLLVGRDEAERGLQAALADLSREMAGPTDVYVTLDLFLSLLEQTGLPTGPGERLRFHVLLSTDVGSPSIGRKSIETLMRHVFADSARRRVTFYLAPTTRNAPFVYVEGRFSFQLLPGVATQPVGVLMRSPRYLMEFGLFAQRLYRKPACVTGSRILDSIRNDWERTEAILATCEGLYAFDNIGFFANAEQLKHFHVSPLVRERMATALSILIRRPIPMLVCVDSVDSYNHTRTTWVPGLGALPLRGHAGVDYISTYEELLKEEIHPTLYVTMGSFVPGAIAVLAKYILVYLSPTAGEEDWFVLLPRALCTALDDDLERLLREEAFALDPQLWQMYLRQLGDAP